MTPPALGQWSCRSPVAPWSFRQQMRHVSSLKAHASAACFPLQHRVHTSGWGPRCSWLAAVSISGLGCSDRNAAVLAISTLLRADLVDIPGPWICLAFAIAASAQVSPDLGGGMESLSASSLGQQFSHARCPSRRHLMQKSATPLGFIGWTRPSGHPFSVALCPSPPHIKHTSRCPGTGQTSL